MIRSSISAAIVVLMMGTTTRAALPLPPGDKQPLLRLEAGGPTSIVTALAFSPDGKTLYAAGFDKVVRVWVRGANGAFTLDRAAYRIPIGPGLNGVINALALSDDGAWLAVAGRGVFRGETGFLRPGQWLPASEMSDDMLQDQGLIYVYHTRRQEVRLLRGHRGAVRSLAFAPMHPGRPPLLVSAAREPGAKANAFTGMVRIWDVEQAKEWASGLRLPDLYTPQQGLRQPGLAVWNTGKQLQQIHVALAWGDGKLRIWDPAPDSGKVWEAEDGTFNTSVSYLPDQEKVLTCSRHPASDGQEGWGQVNAWSLVPGQGPRLAARVRFLALAQAHYYPWLLAPFASHSDGKLDRAAVILRQINGTEESYLLRTIDLAPGHFQAQAHPIHLWGKSGIRPVLAAAPRSGHLAMAGSKDHAITLYALPDLDKTKIEPQKLRSEGMPQLYVSFTRNGQELGLLLSETDKDKMGAQPREARLGDRIFAFAKQPVLTTDLRGWKSSAPAVADGDVEFAPPSKEYPRPYLGVRQADGKKKWTALKTGQQVTDYALLPAGPFPAPILAVAFLDEFGQPMLALYNAASGELVRQLTGHQGFIRCLAFAADGRVLASAAEDQTVNVWSLVNLDLILDRRGQLRDVTVVKENGDLVVQSSPAKSKLEKRSVVLGLVQDKQLKPLADARELYDAVFEIKPGSTLTLRVRTPQGQVQDVQVPVSQGVDERKPLLTLFVTRGGPQAPSDWVAWNPLGPYEASARKAERHIGWHVNTGQPKEPATFALADEYRKENYKPGILKRLIDKGSLTGAMIDSQQPRDLKKPPTLILELVADGAAPKQVGGKALLQQGRARLNLTIPDFDDPLHSVEWRLDNGELQPFTQALSGTWSADLAQVKWERGIHKLSVAVRLREDQPRPYTQELTLQYQPPPPVMEIKTPLGRVVKAPEFPIQVLARPGLEGQKVKVRLLHQHGKDLVRREWEIDREREINEKLQLRPGHNQIEVTAINADALAGAESLETSFQSLTVDLANKPLPSIVLQTVEPLASERGETIAIVARRPIIVHVPRVRVVGKITASDKLDRAVWVKDGSAMAHSLAGFEAGKLPEVAVSQELALEPGPQRFRFQARTTAGDEAEPAVLTMDYRPPLPELVLSAPPNGAILLEGKDLPEVQLQGRLVPTSDRRPIQAVILVNDQELSLRPLIDEQTRSLTARVPLRPGSNRILVRLSNEWQETRSMDQPVNVSYLRPPCVIEVAAPKPRKLLVDLEARVFSSSPLSPTVEVLINGWRQRLTADLTPPDMKAKEPIWSLHVKDVPLGRKGANDLQLWVSNTEAGWCLKAGALTIAAREAPQPPVVELDPKEDFQTNERQVVVKIRIKSASLPKVQLVREQVGSHWRKNVDVQLKAPEVYAGEVPVDLLSGLNELRVLAKNEDGESETRVIGSYLEQAVRLAIDRMELKGPPSQFMVPEIGDNHQPVFPRPLPEGKVWVHGHVEWRVRTDPRLEDKKAEVRILVNGFRQPPVPLQPRSGNSLTRAFQVGIVLNRALSNQVEIELPDFKQVSSNRTRFQLDCLKPESEQRLRVLIVAAGETDENKVRGQVLRALQAKPTSRNGFTSEAFRSGYIYGPLLSEDVTSQRIGTYLHRIRADILADSRGRPSNDVVLIYYQGGESLTADGRFLWSSNERQPALTRADLARFSAWTPGAHIMLLDLARDPATMAAAREQPALQMGDSRFGVLCFARLATDQAPRDVRLITTLDEAMRQGSRLREVAGQLKTRLEPLSQKYPKLMAYEQHLPEFLGDMVISRVP